jgi:carbonic anhydrase
MNPAEAEKIPFLKEWVHLLKPAVEARMSKGHHHGNADAERAAVKLSIERLRGYPFIAEREASGALVVDGLRFDIANGVLELLDHETGNFDAVERPRMFSRWFGSGRRAANGGGLRPAAE